jgi:hypothetical protein
MVPPKDDVMYCATYYGACLLLQPIITAERHGRPLDLAVGCIGFSG